MLLGIRGDVNGQLLVLLVLAVQQGCGKLNYEFISFDPVTLYC